MLKINRSKVALILLIVFLVAGFGYFTLIGSDVTIDYNVETFEARNSSESDSAEVLNTQSFYQTGDSAICRVGSGAVESIYYFYEGDLRVSGAIGEQEVGLIYKDGSVYSWSVKDGEIVSPLNFVGPNARQDNLLDFGPEDYETDCIPWLEVDKSVFVLPEANFEVINN
jgi:hypothetical protein